MKKLGSLLAFIAILALAIPAFAEDEKGKWFDKITFSGVIDARIGVRSFAPESDDFDTENASDIYVFNAGIGAEVQSNPYLSGTIFFLWEEEFGGEDLGMDMDEGYITAQWKGLFGQIGKMYLPVGQFDTFAINDPLVLELAECRQSALGVGYSHDYFGASVWAFNGAFDNVDVDGEIADNAIDTVAARIDFSPLAFQDDYKLTVGGYFLSDAAETSLEFGNGLNQIDPDDVAGSGDEFVQYETDVPLYGGFLNAELPFAESFGLGLAAEYVTTGEFDEKEYFDGSGEATALSAANLELAALLLSGSIHFGPKFEMISGLDWLETQENDPDYEVTGYTQYGGFIGYDLWDHLHLGLQAMAGVDNEGNRLSEATFQTVLEF